MSTIELSNALAELGGVTETNLAAKAKAAGLVSGTEVDKKITDMGLLPKTGLSSALDDLAVVRSANFARAQACSRDVGIFGDSRAFLSHSGGQDGSGTNNNIMKGYGLAHWLQVYSQGAVRFPWSLNGGVAGDSTAQCLARQPAYITRLKTAGCNLVVMVCGTNDRTGGNFDLGATKQNVREMVRNFQVAGISVILSNDTPRGNGSSSYELTQQQWKDDHYAFSRWVLSDMSKMCAVLNTYDAWLDPNSGKNYYPLAGVTNDFIHPSKLGAQLWGKVGGPLLQLYSRSLAHILESNAGYDATNNPNGALTLNPLMTGTGGYLDSNVNAMSGSVLAANWSAEGENMSGLTTQWSTETDANGVIWQKATVVGTSGSSQPKISLFCNLDLNKLSNNDKVKATGLMRSKGAGLSAVSASLLMTPSWTLKQDADDSDSALAWPTDDSGVMFYETPHLVFLTASNHSLLRARYEVMLQPSKAVNATLWFTKCGAFKFTY
jgi:lysophospholipase L1-like esterase